MPFKISVPEKLGGGLRLLPEGTVRASLSDITSGVSQTKQPKANVFYTLMEEMEGVGGEEPTTIGEKVLETFSLQPQALWRLNDLYKAVTGEDLEHRDWDTAEEFVAMLKGRLLGSEWMLYLEQDNEQTRVADRKKL